MVKPNVVVIFADQMRGDTMGCAGHPLVRTPNLDRLADEGCLFTRAYTPDPICVPARAAFTTGNYPHRCTGTKNNGGRIGDDQVKIAAWFGRNGYRTYASGKLHYVPYSPPGSPRLVHGFEQVALHESGRILAAFDPGDEKGGLEDYHDYLKSVGWGGYARAHGIGNNDIHPAPAPMPAEHYCDAWVCDRAMGFVEHHCREHREAPFFLFMSFPKPHAPYDPPRPYDTLYDPRRVPAPRQSEDGTLEARTPTKILERITHGWDRWSPECHRLARAYYYGQVTFQDEQIGRMLDFLEAKGVLDNTIVVYTADHGDLLGDFGFFAKSCFYDGSVRIPFIIRWPAALRQGCRPDQLVGLQDLLPTLTSLAGIGLPKAVHGMDLSPILKGESCEEREYFVSTCMDPPNQLVMVVDRQWKYCHSQRGGVEELYDLVHDPEERVNVAGRPGSIPVLETMRSRLFAWAEEVAETKLFEGKKLACSPAVDPESVGFHPGSMGWRWT